MLWRSPIYGIFNIKMFVCSGEWTEDWRENERSGEEEVGRDGEISNRGDWGFNTAGSSLYRHCNWGDGYLQ